MLKKRKYPAVERVKLRPWHGIRPAYYILGIFISSLILLFILICILPGIISNKAYITLDTSLPLLGVSVDERYLGNGVKNSLETTSGTHIVSFTYEGIELGRMEVKIPKRIFFSLFVHKPYVIEPEVTYGKEVREKAKEEFARSSALYSQITTYTAVTQYPHLFEEYAMTVIEMNEEDISDVWLYAMLHITSRTMYDDYLKGKELLSSSNVKYETALSSQIDSFLFSVYSVDEDIAVEKIDETTDIVVEKVGSFYKYSSGSVTLGESTITNYPESNVLPKTIEYDTFYISGNLITENEYALFVEENTKWSKSNISSLIDEGLVDSNYLKGITLSQRSSRPIRYISYYAAQAYCEWKSNKDGVKYTLPSITQWTVAALSAKDKAYVTSLIYRENDSSTPSSLMGQLWDITSTPYIPLMRLVDSDVIYRLSSLFPFDDIIVMGGSYANTDVTISSVGVVSKNSSSEFNGFRLVKYE